MTRTGRDERGASLVTAMFVAFVMAMLTAVLFAQAGRLGQQTGRDRTVTTAFHIAEAGLDDTFSKLASNPSYTGGAGSVTADGATLGSYSVTVATPVGSTDERVVTSLGTTSNGQKRTIVEQVRLVPLGAFDYAVFSASTMGFQNNLNVIGNTYSAAATALQQQTVIAGNVHSPQNVSTANNSTINGDIWSGGNVVIATGTTVTGNVLATGSVVNNGTVNGDVRAASITNNGTVLGQQVISSQPAPPTKVLPTFAYDPASFAGIGTPVNMTGSQFETCWSTGIGCPLGVSRTSMQGIYRITDGGTVTSPNQRTTLTGDLYIISSGIVNIQRDFDTATAGDHKLVVITTSSSISPPAISWSNNVTLPANVKTFMFAYGLIAFNNLKSFHGVVYGGRVSQSQHFTLTYEPSMRDTIPGFDWSNGNLFDVVPGFWRECPTPDSC